MKSLNTFFVTALLLSFSINSQAIEPDWTAYDALLKTYVKQNQRHGVDLMTVDYLGIKKDPLYLKVIAQIKYFNVAQLNSREEKLAFYINAYNILAIKMVLDHWPRDSIKDVGNLFFSVWNKDVGYINQKIVTLNDIEHEILRKMDEPRIHVAIVCASVSCPDLRNEPYTSKTLFYQLDEQATRFLNNSGKGARLIKNTVKVSKIFDWFEDDFDSVGGVKNFIKRYRKDLPTHVSIDADMPYNWKLNIK